MSTNNICPTCHNPKLAGFRCFHGCDDWAELERERYDEPDDDVRELLASRWMGIDHDEQGRPIVVLQLVGEHDSGRTSLQVNLGEQRGGPRTNTVPEQWNHGSASRSCTCKSGSPTCPTCTDALEDEARGYL